MLWTCLKCRTNSDKTQTCISPILTNERNHWIHWISVTFTPMSQPEIQQNWIALKSIWNLHGRKCDGYGNSACQGGQPLSRRDCEPKRGNLVAWFIAKDKKTGVRHGASERKFSPQTPKYSEAKNKELHPLRPTNPLLYCFVANTCYFPPVFARTRC